MRNKKYKTLAQRKARNGRLFILPFTIGFIFFFLQPLVLSFYYSFTTNKPTNFGMEFNFVGLDNFIYLFKKDASFLPALFENVQTMIVKMIVITLFSIFFAVILNQKFKGRTFVRAVAFLPVIVSSGVVISILYEDVFNVGMRMGGETSTLFKSTGLDAVLAAINLPEFVSEFMVSAISGIFDMLWDGGVQILIFLAALQGVPSQLYEAANVEGATAWESFWKITFPMISPMVLISVIYTIIDSFTNYSNPVMKLISREGINNMRYSYACAMSWIFFTFVIMLVAIVYGLLNHFLVKKVRS